MLSYVLIIHYEETYDQLVGRLRSEKLLGYSYRDLLPSTTRNELRGVRHKSAWSYIGGSLILGKMIFQ